MKQEITLSEKVKALRLDRGWTQRHLADASGVDERTVRRIESGTKAASLDTLQALAEAFKIDCSELTNLATEPPKSHAKVQVIALRDGHDLINALVGSHAYVTDAEHTDDDEVAVLIQLILETIDVAEIWRDLSPSEIYEEGRRITKILRDLESHGYSVCVVQHTGTQALLSSEVPNWTGPRQSRVEASDNK